MCWSSINGASCSFSSGRSGRMIFPESGIPPRRGMSAPAMAWTTPRFGKSPRSWGSNCPSRRAGSSNWRPPPPPAGSFVVCTGPNTGTLRAPTFGDPWGRMVHAGGGRGVGGTAAGRLCQRLPGDLAPTASDEVFDLDLGFPGVRCRIFSHHEVEFPRCLLDHPSLVLRLRPRRPALSGRLDEVFGPFPRKHQLRRGRGPRRLHGRIGRGQRPVGHAGRFAPETAVLLCLSGGRDRTLRGVFPVVFRGCPTGFPVDHPDGPSRGDSAPGPAVRLRRAHHCRPC